VQLKRRLEDRDISVLRDTEVVANQTSAPVSVPIPEVGILTSLPPREHEFMFSSFASTAVGMSIIISCSVIALIFAAFLFYKGMQKGKGKHNQWKDRIEPVVIDLTDAFQTKAARNLHADNGDKHTISSSSKGSQSKIDRTRPRNMARSPDDLEGRGQRNRTQTNSTEIVPFDWNTWKRSSRRFDPEERERIMRAKIRSSEAVPPKRNGGRRNSLTITPQEREVTMRAKIRSSEAVPPKRNTGRRNSLPNTPQERDGIMRAKIRSSEAVSPEGNAGRRSSLPLNPQERERIVRAKIRSSEALPPKRNAGRRNSLPITPQEREGIMRAKIRSSGAVTSERNAGRRNPRPPDPKERIGHAQLRSTEAVPPERNAGRRNSLPHTPEERERIVHAKIRSSKAMPSENYARKSISFNDRLELKTSQGDRINANNRSMAVGESTARRKKTAPKLKTSRGDLTASAPTSLSFEDQLRLKVKAKSR